MVGTNLMSLLLVHTHTEVKSLLSLQIMPYWWDLSFSLALAADVVLGYVTWTLCYSHWVPWPGFTFTRQAWQHHTHISSARPPVLGSVEHSFCLAGTRAAGASHSATLSSETHELEIDCILSACSFMQNSGPKLHLNIMDTLLLDVTVHVRLAWTVVYNCLMCFNSSADLSKKK